MKELKERIINLKSWGNYQKISSRFHQLTSEITAATIYNYIPRGNGRSYGDCALNEHTIHTNSYNTMISFDAKNGIIQCQSGILLSDIIKIIVPQRWFFHVTPGTKYVSIGGATAADIHGKNHHKKGCFSKYVISLKLALPGGNVITCSSTENSEIFRATCGGMGLTGTILEVTIQLQSIQSYYMQQHAIQINDLKQMFKAFEKHEDSTYMVAWLDATCKKKQAGKGVLFVGEHAKDHNFEIAIKRKINIPRWFPSFLLNPWSIKIYNTQYYKKQAKDGIKVSLDTFFYPLDSIPNWNRIYGKKGFVQYQVVIPKKKAYDGIIKILTAVHQSKHLSYLTVLKLSGSMNDNLLSFPLNGYSIALDFKVKEGLLDFLNELDDIVSKYNGRAYLAKDGRMSKKFFEQGYPKANTFRNVRKKYQLEQLQSLQSKRLGL